MSHELDFGISKEHCEKICEALSGLLADTYALYLKTQNYHWNVEDDCFYMLHEAFEDQYEELRDAVDELAERIRQLGHRAPGSFKEFSQLTKIEESDQMFKAKHMIERLAHDHAYISRKCRETLALVEKAGDHVTEDLLAERMAEHEKTAWMLHSCLKG